MRLSLPLKLKLLLWLLLLKSNRLCSEGARFRLPPLFFPPLVVSLLNLPFELFLIRSLLEFLFEGLGLVTYLRCISIK